MSQPEGLEAMIVERVNTLRTDRSLTWGQLATACAGVGGERMTSHALRKTMAGERRMSVHQWIVLSLALDVSPIALLVPPERRAMKLTPERPAVLAEVVYAWLVGLRPMMAGPLTDRMRVQARRALTELVPWLRGQPTADAGIDPAAVVELVEDLLRDEPHPLDPKTKGERILQGEFVRAAGMCRNAECPVREKPFARVDAWWVHLCTEHPGSVRQYNVMERLTAHVNPEVKG